MTISPDRTEQPTLDVPLLRSDTPGVANVLHFNNAGAALPPRPVARRGDGPPGARGRHRRLRGRRRSSRSGRGRLRRRRRADRRAARRDRVRGEAPRAPGTWRSTRCRSGRETASSPRAPSTLSNYLAFLQMKARAGIEIDVVDNDASGQLDLAALERAIGPRTRLIAITHVPTQGGLVNPAAEVGRIAARHGILYLLDACQSVGQLAVDVRQIGCHMLSATGPQVPARPPRHRLPLRAARHHRHARAAVHRSRGRVLDRRRHLRRSATTRAGSRTGSDSSPARSDSASPSGTRCGLGIDAIEARVKALAALLRRELAKQPGVTVHDLGAEQCGIVTFLKDGEAPGKTRDRLRAMNINVHVSRSPARTCARSAGARTSTRWSAPACTTTTTSPRSSASFEQLWTIRYDLSDHRPAMNHPVRKP